MLVEAGRRILRLKVPVEMGCELELIQRAGYGPGLEQSRPQQVDTDRIIEGVCGYNVDNE